MAPYLDRAALVERGLNSAEVSEAAAASWRNSAEGIDNLSYFSFTKGSKFYCLGTFTHEGEPVLALRSRQPSGKFGYTLLHLTGNPDKPIDDYLILENGYWHSELQMFFEQDKYKPFDGKHGEYLRMSYDQKHAEILEDIKKLPDNLQNTQLVFGHYINAVMTTTTRGEEMQNEDFVRALNMIDSVYPGPMQRAYWRIIFLARSGNIEGALAEVDVLTGPYDDPIADEVRLWIKKWRR